MVTSLKTLSLPASVIVADPPWSFSDKLGTRGAEANYKTMTTDEIATFYWPHHVADNAVLFLWRVAALGAAAYTVAAEWGFVPKAEIVWRKVNPNGKPRIGMGRYVRNVHETCLIAVRGKCPVNL